MKHSKMPRFQVDKSIEINASAKKIKELIGDFHNWKPWSPWLITDPNTVLNIDRDGKYYDWEGEFSGAGNMRVTEESDSSIRYELNILKPWKSKSIVEFVFLEHEDSCTVHWSMDSGIPFFLFWMKNMMISFVGMDYERGLQMLKEFVEEGEVHSELTFQEKKHFSGCKYIGVESDCTILEVGKRMSLDYSKLMEYILNGNQEILDGPSFSIYHKFNPVKNEVSYTACVSVKSRPDDLPSEFVYGEIPETKVYSILHKGPYKHLGNVWNAQYSRLRARKFRHNKSISPMELYHNDPTNTPQNELLSEVIFPMK